MHVGRERQPLRLKLVQRKKKKEKGRLLVGLRRWAGKQQSVQLLPEQQSVEGCFIPDHWNKVISHSEGTAAR